MLQAIVRWSLNNRIAVGVVAVLLLLTGLFAAQHSRLDVFPEFAPPQVVLQTEAPGLSPREVLRLCSRINRWQNCGRAISSRNPGADSATRFD